ncbi:MAG: F0F1 ATP synthase subunit delta [Tannerella sp.]|jgi:F-type H+-transporting ATPase subunit delta|nr:F0F1 ATP synthase subunit delta [Tannerella sp.]
MNEGLISRRYAKALYEYAVTLKEEEALYKRLQVLSTQLQTIPQLKEVLYNPMISSNEKATLLNEATGKSPEQSYVSFVRLVLENRREKSILHIALSYQSLYRKKKNIRVVSLISTEELQPGVISRIRKDVTDETLGTVEFTNRIDPSLEGGFIFQLNDLRLDASVKNQLERVRRQFLQKNKTIV